MPTSGGSVCCRWSALPHFDFLKVAWYIFYTKVVNSLNKFLTKRFLVCSVLRSVRRDKNMPSDEETWNEQNFRNTALFNICNFHLSLMAFDWINCSTAGEQNEKHHIINTKVLK